MSKMRLLLILLVGLSSFLASANELEDSLLHVYARDDNEYFGKQILPLHNDDLAWLYNKKQLILGVPEPDNPPMDITIRSGNYEGVTADIIGILSKILGVDFLVKKLPSRSAAVDALKRGEIDLLSTSNIYEKEQGLLLTDKYIDDEPAIYKNINIKDKNIRVVAVPEYYLPAVDIMRYLPDVKIKVYPSKYSAVSAVSYGDADAVMMDLVSGNFLINNYYQDTIRLSKLMYSDTQGFAFSLNKSNHQLKKIIDIALHEILEKERDEIAKRWSGGGLSISADKIKLTSSEWSFLSERRKLKIAVSSGLPPLSFLDVNGTLHGVTADLLQVVRVKLGVDIEVIPVETPQRLTQLLEKGRVDAAIMAISEEGRQRYRFSRAFIMDPLVYAVHLKQKDATPSDLLKADSVGVVRDAALLQAISNVYGKLNIKLFDKSEDALRCVAIETCSVAVLPLRVAKYLINSKFPDRLTIRGELFNSIPISAALAVPRGQTDLLNILDKVIATIPPDELEGLSNRWRVNARQEAISWREFMDEFGIFISLILLLIIWVSLWGLSLRKQMRERRVAEVALSAQLKFIEDLVDGTPHPIYARDQDGRLILCNSSYAAFFGEPKAGLLGSGLAADGERWPFLAPLFADLAAAREERQAQEGDHRLVMVNEAVDVYHWVQPYYDLDGKVQGGIGGWIDVSERLRLLDDLAVASQEAQEANRRFWPHEPRNSYPHECHHRPAGVDSAGEIVCMRRIKPRSPSPMARQTDLLTLIGDILDISKIESGRLELVPEPHDIAALTESVVTVFNALARQKNLQLELVIGAAHWVQVDGLCYKQILSNLISNAIKYTELGSVRVELQLQLWSSDGWCTLQLVVRDTGIGIAPAELARLFQPFSQASQPEHIQQSGTGLGLMISRSLCESMGGSLVLESELGRGTRVCVEMKLPLATAVEKPLSGELDSVMARGDRLRVMIVDDHPTNRLLISQQLAYLGHEAMAAESGEQALALFAEYPFDVVITDFNMPGMNGFELTRQCRAREYLNGRHRCVILGLTADARQEQVNEGHAAGMDDCLFKPVGLEALDHCLRRHMQREEQADVAACMQEIRQCLGPLTGHQSALMLPLLAEFVRASDDDLQALQQAATAGELARFLDYVHRLKGGARIMGAMQLVATCSEIESGELNAQTLPMALQRLQRVYHIARLAIVRLQRAEPG
uniref:histidine kinase n=1 Tax=Aeromonas hydrophila TaxID=644 RepID=Q49KA4_AERHY|nr:BvgS [Aeromonas piscicola]